jgi:hypothetical protein
MNALNTQVIMAAAAAMTRPVVACPVREHEHGQEGLDREYSR